MTHRRILIDSHSRGSRRRTATSCLRSSKTLCSGRTRQTRSAWCGQSGDIEVVRWRHALNVGPVRRWRQHSAGGPTAGLIAHAGDLNPVAVLINKALIEIPPRFAGRQPICERRGTLAVEANYPERPGWLRMCGTTAVCCATSRMTASSGCTRP